MHNFELHDFFHSPKNMNLKALLYLSTYLDVKGAIGSEILELEKLTNI